MKDFSYTEKKITLRILTAPGMPESIHGACLPDKKIDDQYIIILNGKMPEDVKTETFLHECRHIWNNDFDRKESAGQIETERHQEEEMLRAWKSLNFSGRQIVLNKLHDLMLLSEYNASSSPESFASYYM